MLGLMIGLIGIVAGYLDLRGFFADQDRIRIANLIFDSKGGIPRSTPGFDGFLEAFPPPKGIDERDITHIVKDVLQTHDQFPISVTCRYLANMKRSVPVASGADIRKWAEATRFGVWSWIITAAGWVVVVITEASEMCKESRAESLMQSG